MPHYNGWFPSRRDNIIHLADAPESGRAVLSDSVAADRVTGDSRLCGVHIFFDGGKDRKGSKV